MAKKPTRPKRSAPKRSSIEQALVANKRQLERVRRLERDIRALLRQAMRAKGEAESALWVLAKTVFDSDPGFRASLVEAARASEARDADLLAGREAEPPRPSLADA